MVEERLSDSTARAAATTLTLVAAECAVSPASNLPVRACFFKLPTFVFVFFTLHWRRTIRSRDGGRRSSPRALGRPFRTPASSSATVLVAAET